MTVLSVSDFKRGVCTFEKVGGTPFPPVIQECPNIFETAPRRVGEWKQR